MDVRESIWNGSVEASTGLTDVIAGGELIMNVPTASIMVESTDDLTALGTYPPGTIAYTPGYKAIYQLKGDRSAWVSLLSDDTVDII